MKVSDEIRNWCEFEDGTECGGFVTKASFDKLCALADRIDAEMVELPKDADGEPIHLGHTVFTKDDPETSWSVRYIEFRCGREQSIGIESNGVNTYRQPSRLTHTAPDSLERIADELDEMVDAADSADDRCEKLADLADRIRKLAKKEDRQCQ